MTQALNIIFISCKVCIDSSSQSPSLNLEKTILKKQIDDCFDIAFKTIGNSNRMILTTENSVSISYTGPPTDAILVATEILLNILLTNNLAKKLLTGRIGIHLQPVQLADDFKEQASIIAHGFDHANQMMQKAKVNEISVSSAYYENVPQSVQALVKLNELDSKLGLEQDLEEDSAPDHLHQNQTDQTSSQPQMEENQPIFQSQLQAKTHKPQSIKKPGFLNAYPIKQALAGFFIVIGLLEIAKLATDSPFVQKPQVPQVTQVPKVSQPPEKTQAPQDVQLPQETLATNEIPVTNETPATKELQVPQESYLPKKTQVKAQPLKIDSLDPKPLIFVNKSQAESERVISEPDANEFKIVSIPNKPEPNKKVSVATTKKEVKRLTKNSAEPNDKKFKIVKKAEIKKPSTWQTIKNHITDGGKMECTQPQKAINQC